MTPHVYRRLAHRVYKARRLLFFVVAWLLVMAVVAPAAAKYLLATGMLVWGLAMVPFWFDPKRGVVAGRPTPGKTVLAWLGALGLTAWFALSLFWFVA